MRLVFLILLVAVATAWAQQADPDQLLNAAIQAQQSGDMETAIRDYREVLKLRPDTVEAKVNLGAALVRLGRFDEGIAMYRSALPGVSFKNPVLLDLGLAYYKKGDFPKAREQFLDLHRLAPKDLRAALLLGDCDLRTGKPQDAVNLLLPFAPENSRNMDLQYVLGSALIAAGQRRQGVLRIETVAKTNRSADSYLLAGATLLDMNDFQSARRDLESALRLNPELPGIYTLVGKARDNVGDIPQAEEAFRKALDINPNDFDANLYLGAILYKQRKMQDASLYLDRALKLKPSDTMARYESAMWKSTEGQYGAAAAQLEQLVKDDPNWLDPHVELATLYYKLHRPKDGDRERQVVQRLTAEQQTRGPGK